MNTPTSRIGLKTRVIADTLEVEVCVQNLTEPFDRLYYLVKVEHNDVGDEISNPFTYCEIFDPYLFDLNLGPFDGTVPNGQWVNNNKVAHSADQSLFVYRVMHKSEPTCVSTTTIVPKTMIARMKFPIVGSGMMKLWIDDTLLDTSMPGCTPRVLRNACFYRRSCVPLDEAPFATGVRDTTYLFLGD